MAPIPPEYLPPRELWPTRVYTLPEYAGYPPRMNSTEELLDRTLEAGRGDRPALLYEEVRITYAQLAERVNRFGNALKALGVREEDRVAIQCPSIPPAIVANFAVIKIGGISVPTSPLFSTAELEKVFNNAEVVAVLVAAPMLETVEKARSRVPTLRHVIVVGGNAEEHRQKGYLVYEDLVKDGGTELPPVRRARDAISVLLYTSGTTGTPKGTAHFMEEALVVSDGFGKLCWRLSERDVVGGPAPISLAAGYSTVAVIPYRFGAAVSLLPRFTPEGMFETIQKHRITVCSILPTAYRKMLQVPDAGKYDLSSLRLLTGGGESLTAQTYFDWKQKFGMEIFEGLGTTEMMFVFISNTVDLRAKPGSCGKAVPGYEVMVVDDEGRRLNPGEIGHLIARGPTGTLYWRPHEDGGELLHKQQASVRDGWNTVGDYAYLDEGEHVFFVSREDDIIKSSGYRIGPEEVEQAVLKHPAVADAGVIGVPDPVRGQNVVAFVVLRPGAAAAEALGQGIIESCRESVAVYKLPREVRFVKELPRTVTGKLLRRELRKLLA
ncbi:MAG: acyl-CoA synthetase [Deltaproteobacteria bacterium]|nr:acyl-CoA synthetase [Deltaproteobacteria bacterium]